MHVFHGPWGVSVDGVWRDTECEILRSKCPGHLPHGGGGFSTVAGSEHAEHAPNTEMNTPEGLEMAEFAFTRVGPNAVLSSAGHRIETIGRAGMVFEAAGLTIEIDSEMLAPPMSIGVYATSIAALAPLTPAEILDEVVQGLKFLGFEVQVIGQVRAN